MFSLKNLYIFLAGAAFFHTISHLLVPYFMALPVVFFGITLTATLNNWIIGLSAAVTVILLWLAARAK